MTTGRSATGSARRTAALPAIGSRRQLPHQLAFAGTGDFNGDGRDRHSVAERRWHGHRLARPVEWRLHRQCRSRHQHHPDAAGTWSAPATSMATADRHPVAERQRRRQRMARPVQRRLRRQQRQQTSVPATGMSSASAISTAMGTTTSVAEQRRHRQRLAWPAQRQLCRKRLPFNGVPTLARPGPLRVTDLKARFSRVRSQSSCPERHSAPLSGSMRYSSAVRLRTVSTAVTGKPGEARRGRAPPGPCGSRCRGRRSPPGNRSGPSSRR